MEPVSFSHMIDAVKNFAQKESNGKFSTTSPQNFIYLHSSENLTEVVATTLDGCRLARERTMAFNMEEPFSVAIKVPRIKPTKHDGIVSLLQLEDNTVAVKFGDIMLLSQQPQNPSSVDLMYDKLCDCERPHCVRLNRSFVRDAILSLHTPTRNDVYIETSTNPNDPVRLFVNTSERFILPIRFLPNERLMKKQGVAGS